MQVSIPTSLEELVETQVSSEAGTVEEDASRSPWVESFLQSPGMRDRDRREMLYFRLLTSRLFRTSTDQMENTRKILQEMRTRFFSDIKYQQPSIHFTDIHNVVPEIFRLYFIQIYWSNILLFSRLFDSSLIVKKEVISVRAKLLELSEDEAVRTGLEPAFNEFIKRPSYHPLGVIQTCKNCILSLL